MISEELQTAIDDLTEVIENLDLPPRLTKMVVDAAVTELTTNWESEMTGVVGSWNESEEYEE